MFFLLKGNKSDSAESAQLQIDEDVEIEEEEELEPVVPVATTDQHVEMAEDLTEPGQQQLQHEVVEELAVPEGQREVTEKIADPVDLISKHSSKNSCKVLSWMQSNGIIYNLIKILTNK